jgi:hypothetical protein
VRVRVSVARFAMRSPARVRDPRRSPEAVRYIVFNFLEGSELGCRLITGAMRRADKQAEMRNKLRTDRGQPDSACARKGKLSSIR